MSGTPKKQRTLYKEPTDPSGNWWTPTTNYMPEYRSDFSSSDDGEEEEEQEDDFVELYSSAEPRPIIGDGGRQAKLTNFFRDDDSIPTVAALDDGMPAGTEVQSVGELSGNNITTSNIDSKNSSVMATPVSGKPDCQNTSNNG